MTDGAARTNLLQRLWAGQTLPVIVVVAIVLAFWYAMVIPMNASRLRTTFENNNQTYTFSDLVAAAFDMEKPNLPAPHQIVAEMQKTIVDMPATSKRSLVYHGMITLESTLTGFIIGSLFGVLLAILIVHMKSLDRSLMPWIVMSQTIPILALAPMIVVIFNQFDVPSIAAKAAISAYLSFFPVTVGMVKGLRSPDPLQLDLMRTYSASRWQTFFKLRLPASVPFLFTSLKVAVAASLVGAIVAEMTKSEDGGFGARLLAGSYYGQTIQIWAALMTAALCACVLVALVGLADSLVARRMGAAR